MGLFNQPSSLKTPCDVNGVNTMTVDNVMELLKHYEDTAIVAPAVTGSLCEI